MTINALFNHYNVKRKLLLPDTILPLLFSTQPFLPLLHLGYSCASPASRVFRDYPNPPHLPGTRICLFVTNEAKTVLKYSSEGTGAAQTFPWSPVVPGGGCSLWRSCRLWPWKPRSQPGSTFPLAQPQGTFPCSPCSKHHVCYREKLA